MSGGIKYIADVAGRTIGRTTVSAVGKIAAVTVGMTTGRMVGETIGITVGRVDAGMVCKTVSRVCERVAGGRSAKMTGKRADRGRGRDAVRLCLSIAASLVFVCCDSSQPKLQSGGPGGGPGTGPQTVSIAYLKSLYTGVPYTVDKELRIEGLVVANDWSGNFYKTLVVEDESGGIEIKLDREELFLEYWHGNKVRVNCNSLTLGAYGGLVQLGVRSGDVRYETDYIPRNRIPSVVTNLPDEAREPLPALLTIPEIFSSGPGGRYVNCYVAIKDVQFVDTELTWSEPDVDTDRELADRNGNLISVRTSRYAEFAGYGLPRGSGTIRGVLGYFNGKYQLRVFDHRLVEMDGGRF